MNSKTAIQLKQDLLSKKDILVNLQNQNNLLDTEEDGSVKDPIDRSDVEESWFTKERMSQHWKVELKQIQTALQRMDNGTFGTCEDCEEEIPVKRLLARPDATLCLYCQETMEKEMGSIRAAGPGSLNLMQ